MARASNRWLTVLNGVILFCAALDSPQCCIRIVTHAPLLDPLSISGWSWPVHPVGWWSWLAVRLIMAKSFRSHVSFSAIVACLVHCWIYRFFRAPMCSWNVWMNDGSQLLHDSRAFVALLIVGFSSVWYVQDSCLWFAWIISFNEVFSLLTSSFSEYFNRYLHQCSSIDASVLIWLRCC